MKKSKHMFHLFSALLVKMPPGYMN